MLRRICRYICDAMQEKVRLESAVISFQILIFLNKKNIYEYLWEKSAQEVYSFS